MDKTHRPVGARLEFIDDYRGLIAAVMLLDHVSFFFNRLWLSFDKFDPLFPDLPQFWLRYSSEPVAPGFLLINGMMVWYLYKRRTARGDPPPMIRRYLLGRGLFLVLLQLVWVNAAWGGFQALTLDHFGIIGCIGLSMCCTAVVIDRPVWIRLLLAVLIAASYPALAHVEYDGAHPLQARLVELLVTAGRFNSYPLLPWFAIALVGTLIAPLWIERWTTTRQRLQGTLLLGGSVLTVALLIRLAGLYGSEFGYSDLLHPSFIQDLKYPPSLFFSLWFVAINLFCVTLLIALGTALPGVLTPLRVIGRVPLFFYLVHIPLLALVARRMELFYREGGVAEVLMIGVPALAVMVVLCGGFLRLKRSSRHWLVRML